MKYKYLLSKAKLEIWKACTSLWFKNCRIYNNMLLQIKLFPILDLNNRGLIGIKREIICLGST